MLLFVDLGSISYMDSWVTNITFREHNNQNKHNNCIIAVKRHFFVGTTSALVFSYTMMSDFKCTLHFHSSKAMKQRDQ